MSVSETTFMAFARYTSEPPRCMVPSMSRAAPAEYRSRVARYTVGTERPVRSTMSVTVPGSARLQKTSSLDPRSMSPKSCLSEALLSSSATASLCTARTPSLYATSPLSLSLLAAALAARELAPALAATPVPGSDRTASSSSRSVFFIDYHNLSLTYNN